MVDTSGTFTIIEKAAWLQMQQQFTMYQAAAVLLVFAIIGILFLFHAAFPFVWGKFIHKTVTVGILNPNHMITLTNAFSKRDGKFWYNKKRLDFVKVYEGSFFFAGYLFDLLTIDQRTLDDPKYWKACEAAKKMGYRDIDALERALHFSMLSAGDPRVYEIMEKGNYETYKDAASVINPANINIHSPIVDYFFEKVPLSKLMGYGNEIPPEDITGEVDDIYESRKPQNAMMKKMMKVLPMAVILIGISIAAAVVYKVFFST